MENEKWIGIRNYEKLYQVSNNGRVRSLDRIVKHSSGGSKKLKGKVSKLSIDSTGYHVVCLYKEGSKKTFKIHKLVAMMFLNHIPNGYETVVDHINYNKLDNRVDNLQLISQRENLSKDKKGTSMYTGVCLDKKSGKWFSQIRINNKVKYLGCYKKEKDAAKAYQDELNNMNKKAYEEIFAV